MTKSLSLKVVVPAAAGELKISTREKGSDGVPMYNGREFNNKLQRQWAFIRHIQKWWWLHVNAGPQCVTAECN